MTRLKIVFDRFSHRIETAAKGEGSAPFFSIETVLLLFSAVYGGWMCLRARLYEKGTLASQTLPCRVISIGNLIAGGTGKTPMTILVAQLIRDLGYRVVVLSRGYRGRMEAKGGVVSDGCTILKGPEDAGDEPYLMARMLKDIPVVVGQRRYETGQMAAERFHPDVVVLDDAFQHLRLKRDLNLVLLDSRSPFANGHLLPRGLLREPLSALHRADAFIFTRSQKAMPTSTLDRLPQHRPAFNSIHIPVVRKICPKDGRFSADMKDISCLKGKRAIAFAGLADNGQFFDSLVQAGCLIVKTFAFADHYRYGHSDLGRIAATAKKEGARLLVTTFKDFVKIEARYPWPVALVAVDVQVELPGNAHHFHAFISKVLRTPEG